VSTMTSTVVNPAVAVKKAFSEPEFVTRAKQGDEQAFALLFEMHKKRVYSLCFLMTGDATEAEDLTQEAFITVFRKLHTFRGDAAFSTWLYRVAYNTVLMRLRKKDNKQVSLDEPVRLESSYVRRDFGRHDSQLVGTVDRMALARAISNLPAGCRMIFLLHEVEGYEHHEIARLLHCSIGNSKSQLHKAKMKLRESMLAERRRSQEKGGAQTGEEELMDVSRTPLSPWEILVGGETSR
jgi:RNA polymerase sigma-70 factor, ECF subfamily